ncbi:glycosyltransferase family 39 protein [bacterium]|nr:glycosyltransferase family 39 protein [bacterium]MCI0604749.1 glycosyltransferase family 39 protein [bacterium]
MVKDSKIGKYAALIAICLFAFVIRAAILMPPINIGFDARKRYVPQAKNLLAGNGFSKSTKAPYKPDTSEHNPGYAFFLAGTFLVSNNSNLRFVAFVQLILELLTIYLTGLIAQLLGLNERAKRMAIITALLCPLLARYTRVLAAEILATFFITLSLYLVLLSIRRERTLFWVAAGLACAFAWFARADQVLIIPLLVLSCAILSRKIAKSLLLVLTFFAAASPWIIRNYQIAGRFAPVGDLTLKSRLPQVKWANSWITEMDDHYRYSHNLKLNPNINYAKLTRQEMQKGKIRVYVVVPFLRLINVIKDDLPKSLYKIPKWIPDHVFAYCTVVLGILGIAISIYRREWILLLPLCVIVGRCILPMMTAAAMHFRLLVEGMPAVYIFAGIAANSIYETARKFDFKRPASN